MNLLDRARQYISEDNKRRLEKIRLDLEHSAKLRQLKVDLMDDVLEELSCLQKANIDIRQRNTEDIHATYFNSKELLFFISFALDQQGWMINFYIPNSENSFKFGTYSVKDFIEKAAPYIAGFIGNNNEKI